MFLPLSPPHLPHPPFTYSSHHTPSFRLSTSPFLSTISPPPQEDNGVKLVDPMGEMVTPAWEVYATQLANAEQEELLTALKDVIEREAISMAQEASVFVGKDTRYWGVRIL